MNKTIEISRQAAEDMLPCLESRLQYLENQITGILLERDSVKTTLAEIRAKLGRSGGPQNNGKPPLRLAKGEGEKLIIGVLKSLPPDGQGLTMAEIVQRTGVKHSTVYRTLSDAKRNKGRFEAQNSLWKLKPK